MTDPADNALSNRYGITRALAFSLVIKGAVFLAGTAIIGLLNSHTTLTACGSNLGGNPPVYTAPYGDLEAYTDYRDLYLRCLVNPFLHGSGAYNLPIVYNYPPLFLYLISIFAYVNFIWFPALPLFLFDVLTTIPIYLISRDCLFKGNSKLAFAIALIWAANPINLFYNDLMWLNPGPVTFFLLLGIYFFLKEKWYLSAASLALATGFKQIAVLVVPILLIVMWKTVGFSKKLFLFIVIYAGLLVGISTPYIFQNPQQYLWALQLPILGNPPGAGPGYPAVFQYDLSQPTRLTTFLGLLKLSSLQSIAVGSYPILNYVFIGAYLGELLIIFFTRGKPSNNDIILYCLTSFLLFFSLFGRGTYKYYFASATALAIPFFSVKRGAILMEAFSLALLLIPRVATPWMSVLIITFIPSFLSPKPTQEG